MGLGQVFTRQRPQAPAENRAITEFAIIDGTPVFGSEGSQSYRGALSIPGAWRASNLVADLLGSVPWSAYVGPVKSVPPLLEQPSPPDTRVTTFSSWALDLLWHGNAIGIVAARALAGTPTAVYPVPAEQVGVRRVDERHYPLPIGTIEYAIGGLTFSPWEVIHIKSLCPPSALRGMGVLETHLSGALELSKEQMRQALALSEHGVPTGYIQAESPDTTTGELKKLKAGWMQSQRTRTVAALNATTKFTPLSWNPEELQLVEARRYSLTDLENIFGLPVGWLGGMNSARQYSNIEQDAVNLLKFTLGGHFARFEAALSLAFPRGTVVKANLDSILRADTLTRYQAHAIALGSEFLTVDEVRELEDRAPLSPEAIPAEQAALDTTDETIPEDQP
jgi:HK97 family phage portal protein